jgi:Spy/CpxP family protein refolding chaperone
VQPPVRGEPLSDLGVTTGALQLALAAAADVTTGAVGGPVEFGMGFGQCAGRELGNSERRKNTQREQ